MDLCSLPSPLEWWRVSHTVSTKDLSWVQSLWRICTNSQFSQSKLLTDYSKKFKQLIWTQLMITWRKWIWPHQQSPRDVWSLNFKCWTSKCKPKNRPKRKCSQKKRSQVLQLTSWWYQMVTLPRYWMVWCVENTNTSRICSVTKLACTFGWLQIIKNCSFWNQFRSHWSDNRTKWICIFSEEMASNNIEYIIVVRQVSIYTTESIG